MRRFATLAVTVVVVVVGTTAASSHAQKPTRVTCGQTITSDTRLATDLINCHGDGIVIGADGITLDLNGHTIDGVAPPFAVCEPNCDYSIGVLVDGHAGV